MIRKAALVLASVSLVTGLSLPGISQTNADLQEFFKNSVGLSQDQIAEIRNGKAIARVVKSRTPAEIFVFGAVYVKAAVQFALDFDRPKTRAGRTG